MMPPNNDTAIILASTLQLLQSQSLGNIYIITYDHSDFEVDNLIVKAKHSNQTVNLSVHLHSAGSIEFIM